MTGNPQITIETLATVTLELESRPESITLVRSMLAGLGEVLQLDPELLDDLKTALSEACNNAVLHAYPDGPGPLHISLKLTGQALEVIVRDEGVGIQRVAAAENRMGVGLAVIMALAQRAEFKTTPGVGTEVHMSFDADGLADRLADLTPGSATRRVRSFDLTGEIVATVCPVELLPQVMGRLVRATAAGAHFSVDRFGGLHELTSAISARAASRDDAGTIGFALDGGSKRIDIRVGPLPPGSRESLFEDGEASTALEPLLSTLEACDVPNGELLHAVVIEPRA